MLLPIICYFLSQIWIWTKFWTWSPLNSLKLTENPETVKTMTIPSTWKKNSIWTRASVLTRVIRTIPLQAFPMNEDFEIETGRRLTDLSRDSNPFISRDSISTSAFGLEDPSGIEVGRRELSVASAFSPMRLSTPGKLADEVPVDYDMNDNFHLGRCWGTSHRFTTWSCSFNTPPRPVAAKVTRKRKVALDEVTELSSTQIQNKSRTTPLILLWIQTSPNAQLLMKLSPLLLKSLVVCPWHLCWLLRMLLLFLLVLPLAEIWSWTLLEIFSG